MHVQSRSGVIIRVITSRTSLKNLTKGRSRLPRFRTPSAEFYERIATPSRDRFMLRLVGGTTIRCVPKCQLHGPRQLTVALQVELKLPLRSNSMRDRTHLGLSTRAPPRAPAQ